MADERVEMVVIDGVRYHPDDAPKKKPQPKPEEKAAPTPRNKARAAANK